VASSALTKSAYACIPDNLLLAWRAPVGRHVHAANSSSTTHSTWNFSSLLKKAWPRGQVDDAASLPRSATSKRGRRPRMRNSYTVHAVNPSSTRHASSNFSSPIKGRALARARLGGCTEEQGTLRLPDGQKRSTLLAESAEALSSTTPNLHRMLPADVALAALVTENGHNLSFGGLGSSSRLSRFFVVPLATTALVGERSAMSHFMPPFRKTSPNAL
jgi:hypothetical protein